MAIAGLAKEMQSRTGWRYLAGLWEENLLLDLLWYSSSEQHHDIRQATYRSPSWSWASVRGDVLYVYEAFRQSTDQGNACIQIIEVQVYPIDDNEFGQVTDGYLKVHRRLTPAGWNGDERYPIESILNSGCSLHFKGVETELRFSLNDHRSRLPEKLWCLPLYLSPGGLPGYSDLFGLVLAKVEHKSHGPSFRRAGFFHAHGDECGYFQVSGVAPNDDIAENGGDDHSEEDIITII